MSPVVGMASFHGDGRFAIGQTLDPPALTGFYEYQSGA